MRFAAAAILVLLVGVEALAQRRPPPPPPSRALELLRRCARMQPQLRFSGERTVELVVDGERQVLTEFVLRDGLRSRTTYPENSPRRGFVVLEIPEGRWEFNPIRNEIRRSPPRRDEAIQLLVEQLRAAENGRLTVQPLEQLTIAGVKAVGVGIGDASGNLGRKMWLDPESGLILKAVQVGRVGQRLAAFEFKRVNYEPVIRPGDFEPLRREGAKYITDEPDFDVPWEVMAPAWLPPGFEPSGRGLRNLGGRPVVLLHYSDGRRHFTVFQSNGPRPPELPPRPARDINSRASRSGDVWSVAMGNLDGETLERVVQSIGRK